MVRPARHTGASPAEVRRRSLGGGGGPTGGGEKEEEKGKAALAPTSQRFFVWMTVCVVVVSALCAVFMRAVIARRLAVWPEYPGVLHWRDAREFGMLLFAICAVRALVTSRSVQLYSRRFMKERERKVSSEDKFVTVWFKVVWFVCISLYGYSVMRDMPWVPSVFGGNGSEWRLFDNPTPPGDPHWWSFTRTPIEPSVRTFYAVQAAYHTHSLLFHLYLPRRNDFYEMVLHHLTTIFLIVFSYMMNYTRIGTIVFLLHDWPDIFGYLTKAFVMTTLNMFSYVSFAATLLTWGFYRLWAFPRFVILPCIYMSWQYWSLPNWILTGLMCCLLCLHCFWYFLFMHLLKGRISHGLINDLQQDTGAFREKYAVPVAEGKGGGAQATK